MSPTSPPGHALPEPDPDARRHSERLVGADPSQIRQAGGAIPFSRYMELALYAPGLGYYSAGARKFGAEGDFVTSPELGPTFAECIAQAVAPALRSSVRTAMFSNSAAAAAPSPKRRCGTSRALGVLPARYRILEPSADLRERQRTRLRAALPPDVFARCRGSTCRRRQNGAACCSPTRCSTRCRRRASSCMRARCYEEHVALAPDGGFAARATSPPMPCCAPRCAMSSATSSAPFADGYRSELLPQLPYWIQAVGGLIEDGAMLFVDYGYPRREYYLPERNDGTLVCHYRHRAHGDPFFLPGLQDLTAFVDFTALAEAGVNAGFDFAGYCAQASFLINNGLAQRLATIEAVDDEVERYRRHQEAKQLTLPGEMGERFQVMGFQRGVDLGAGFAIGDLRRRL